MRGNIEIDGEPMKAAVNIMGLKTRRETVADALRIPVDRRRAHEELMKLRRTVRREGGLREKRRNRHRSEDGEE